MNEHTTHFGDCGCQAARHEAEIAEYREAAIKGAAEHQAMVERLEAENARLREALHSIRDDIDDLGHVDCFRTEQGWCMCESSDSTISKDQIKAVFAAHEAALRKGESREG